MRELTSEQITEWIAYNEIDPIGEWRNDYRFAYLESLITNIVIKLFRRRGAKLTDVKSFMPTWIKTEESKIFQSIDQMKEVVYNIARAFKNNKQIKSKNDGSRISNS